MQNAGGSPAARAARAGIEEDDAAPADVFRQNPPPALFRYRSLAGKGREWTEDIVLNSHFFWPSPVSFNDPFDFAPLVDVPQGIRLRLALLKVRARQRLLAGRRNADEAFKAVSRMTRAQLLERMRWALNDTAEHAGVICYSEVPDNVLMWGHYADSHRGICLRFDPHIAQIEPSNLVYRVQYDEARPMLARFLEREDSGALAQALTTKAAFWKYEREWRAIENKGANLRLPFDQSFLTGIILGCRASAATEELVRDWVRQRVRPTEILRAVPCPETYAITLMPA